MIMMDEFDQYVSNMTDWHLRNLQGLGVTGAAIAKAGLVGTARIETGRKFWQPEEAGKPALIVPVSPDGTFGGIVDFVALQTANPRKWWVRSGLATMLGFWNLEEAAHFDHQLVVHATPLDWLRADCEGVCIVDWRSFLPFHLSGITKVYCPDQMTGERLDIVLKRQSVSPEIRVGGTRHAA